MNHFVKLCDGKIWRAVEGMIVGLETQDARPDFMIHMGTYGGTHHGLAGPDYCYGCAATATVQQLSGVNHTTDCNIAYKESRASLVHAPVDELIKFEQTIDALRSGYLGPLFDLFKKDRQLVLFRNLPRLHTCNWKTGLPAYRELLHDLKTKDL